MDVPFRQVLDRNQFVERQAQRLLDFGNMQIGFDAQFATQVLVVLLYRFTSAGLKDYMQEAKDPFRYGSF